MPGWDTARTESAKKTDKNKKPRPVVEGGANPNKKNMGKHTKIGMPCAPKDWRPVPRGFCFSQKKWHVPRRWLFSDGGGGFGTPPPRPRCPPNMATHHPPRRCSRRQRERLCGPYLKFNGGRRLRTRSQHRAFLRLCNNSPCFPWKRRIRREYLLEHRRNTGRLYGYPPCCIRAFCTKSRAERRAGRLRVRGFVLCRRCSRATLVRRLRDRDWEWVGPSLGRPPVCARAGCGGGASRI